MGFDERWEQLEENEQRLLEDIGDDTEETFEPLFGEVLESVRVREDHLWTG